MCILFSNAFSFSLIVYRPAPLFLTFMTDNKEEAELKFQDISEANEVLSDEELKGKYDRGEAVYDNQGGGSGRQRQHFDPSQFFRQAQGGGGGHQRQHTFHFNSF